MRAENRAVLCLAIVGGLLSAAAVAQEPRRARIPDDVEVVRDLEFGTGGGRALALDVYRPKEPGTKPRPAVVLVHGGGWSRGDKNQVFGAVALVKRGLVAVSAEYRLSGEAPFPAPVEDIKCAVRWLRAHAKEHGVDPDRIGVWGSSAGGQIALMVAYAGAEARFEGKGGWADQSSQVQAICSWFGPSDLRNVDRAPRMYLGGLPQEVPERYAQASPLLHVSADDPPTFIAHGDQDRVVPLEQSQELVRALRKIGVEAELLIVKNGGHVFKPMVEARPELTLPEVEERSADFFARRFGAQ